MRGSISKALSIAFVLPLSLTGACLFKPRPEFPVNWTVRQFCIAGSELPPPVSEEVYEYSFDVTFDRWDEATLTLRPDGSGTLHAKRTHDQRPAIVRVAPETELTSHSVACLRGVIEKMSFWVDYDDDLAEWLCADGDSFSLGGMRQGDNRRRHGSCGEWNYGPYVRVFSFVLSDKGIFPEGELERQ